jgi:hypothetical protein
MARPGRPSRHPLPAPGARGCEAWKERLTYIRDADGNPIRRRRRSPMGQMGGPVPCPIKASEYTTKTAKSRVKSRMDHLSPHQRVGDPVRRRPGRLSGASPGRVHRARDRGGHRPAARGPHAPAARPRWTPARRRRPARCDALMIASPAVAATASTPAYAAPPAPAAAPAEAHHLALVQHAAAAPSVQHVQAVLLSTISVGAPGPGRTRRSWPVPGRARPASAAAR